MPPTLRDLASDELWQRSLERSRHRRELAPIVRKTASRRKRLSLAVSAAVATAPTAPSLAAGESSATNNQTTNALSLLSRHQDPVLLHIGVTSPAVAQLQRALHITADGIYGPQTQGAVRAYQQEHNLAPTGNVDVKTWLTLFPNDTVIATPAGWSATTSGGGATAAGAAGVSSAGATTQPVSDVTAAGATAANGAAGAGAAGGQGAADVHAAAAASPQVSAAASTRAGASSAPDGGGVPAGTFSSAAAPQASGGGDTSGFGGGGGGAAQTTGGPTPQVTAHPGGTAAQLIDAMIAAANRITARHYAYSWGGGHNPSFSGPYDCSGAVSAVLHAAGLLSSPMVSGDFVHWGAPGPGAVTIYANATHVYMSILGHFFGTSGSNPGGGAAWFNGAPRPGFAVVHVPFERMHLRRTPTVRKASRVRVRQASHARTSGSSYASDGGTPAPSSQPASQASDQQPTYDPPPPPPSSAPASSSQTSSSESSSAGTQSSAAAPSSDASSGGSVSSPSESSSSAPASDSSSAAPARTVSSTPDSSGSGSGTTAASESAAASGPVTHATPVEAPVTHTAAPVSSGSEASGSGVSSSESSHVTVSTDSGSSGSASKASTSDSGSSGSSSSAGGSHASGSGSGSSVVKASDG